MIYKIFILFFLLNILSCSGYKVKKRENPWKRHGIHSVTIPMFVNRTIFPNLAPEISKEIRKLVSTFPGLKVYSGESSKANGILLGIVETEKKYDETLKTTQKTFITSSIGERSEFYLPNAQSYQVRVKMILIKNPTTMDIKLAKSSLNRFLVRNSKVIFNEVITTTGRFSRIMHQNTSQDDGALVGQTQNRGLLIKSFSKVGEAVAFQFKELILYAF